MDLAICTEKIVRNHYETNACSPHHRGTHSPVDQPNSPELCTMLHCFPPSMASLVPLLSIIPSVIGLLATSCIPHRRPGSLLRPP
uniref:Uncharacterized protein n=1 Tax=Arundo donax TaxID=35708 RepID=A0A0A9AUE8_ARUDO